MANIDNNDRIKVNIPKGTDIYEFLLKNDNISRWKVLDMVIKQLPKSKEDRSVLIFNDFVERLSELYPETKADLEKLRPLIFKCIIKKEPLDAWYFEELKKI